MTEIFNVKDKLPDVEYGSFLIYGASFLNLIILFFSIIIAIYDFYNKEEFSETIKYLLK